MKMANDLEKGFRSRVMDCVENLNDLIQKADELEKCISRDIKILDMATGVYRLYKHCPSQLMSEGERKAYALAQHIVSKYVGEGEEPCKT